MRCKRLTASSLSLQSHIGSSVSSVYLSRRLPSEQSIYLLRPLANRRLIPAPDVQANLCPGLDRQGRVPRRRMPSAVRAQILPEDGIPLDGLKGDAFVVVVAVVAIALDKPTPLLGFGPGQSREIRTPSRAVRLEIHHERAHAVRAARRARPVVVMLVVARDVVSLSPHALDVQVGPPALEGSRTLLQAPHHIVTLEQRTVGEPCGRVDALGDAIVDDRGDVFPFTEACMLVNAAATPRQNQRPTYLTATK